MYKRISLFVFTAYLFSSAPAMAEENILPLPQDLQQKVAEKVEQVTQAATTEEAPIKRDPFSEVPPLSSLPELPGDVSIPKEEKKPEVTPNISAQDAPPLGALPPAEIPALALTNAPEAEKKDAGLPLLAAPALPTPALPPSDPGMLPSINNSAATLPPMPGLPGETKPTDAVAEAQKAAPVTTAVVEAAPVKKKKFRKKTKNLAAQKVPYRNVLLPDTIYKKQYDRRNKHLPVAYYEKEMDALLFVAIQRDDINGIRAMLDYKKRAINTPNRNGDTPLIAAVKSKSLNAIRLLLGRHADIHAKDARGLTALQNVQQSGNFGIARIITAASGNDIRFVDSSASAKPNSPTILMQ
jgi:Ankyrin repeats (many copies)